jgi:hypothetical protein
MTNRTAGVAKERTRALAQSGADRLRGARAGQPRSGASSLRA